MVAKAVKAVNADKAAAFKDIAGKDLIELADAGGKEFIESFCLNCHEET